MTLKDQMASDLTDVFLNTDDFADDATFVVKGGKIGFAVKAVFGDVSPGFFQVDGGQEDRRPVAVTVNRTVVRAGINGITGTTRDPVKGDALEVSSGANAGNWTVMTVIPDVGDAYTLNCVKATMQTANAPQAREVR